MDEVDTLSRYGVFHLSSNQFYASIPAFDEFSGIADSDNYRVAPDDWHVIIAGGRHRGGARVPRTTGNSALRRASFRLGIDDLPGIQSRQQRTHSLRRRQ